MTTTVFVVDTFLYICCHEDFRRKRRQHRKIQIWRGLKSTRLVGHLCRMQFGGVASSVFASFVGKVVCVVGDQTNDACMCHVAHNVYLVGWRGWYTQLQQHYPAIQRPSHLADAPKRVNGLATQ